MYRLLLRLLPRHRRAAYGDEMSEVFDAAKRASHEHGGRSAMMRFLMREVVGMARFGWRDRMRRLRPAGINEVRWAWRAVRARRGAGVFAVALLALAIAANGVVFAAVDALAFNPFPYPELDRIVRIVDANAPNGWMLEKADGQRVLEHRNLFQHLSAYGQTTIFIQSHGFSERVGVINATPGLFAVLGVTPRWGRAFSDDDVRIHDSDAVVISESLARARFGSPANAVGQTLQTTDAPLRIVGVMPSTFRFPSGTVEIWRGLDLDGPLATIQFALTPVARLQPGQTIADVNHGLGAVFDPGSKIRPEAQPLDAASSRDRTTFLALQGAALCLLLTACANVVNLELAAAFGRVRKYAIQRALGASRALLTRIVLLEGAILIGIAIAGAWLLASFGLELLVAELPRAYGVVPANPVDLDTRAVLFMAAAAGVTWLLIALPVAFFASGVTLLDVLKHDGRAQSGSRITSLIRQGLTAGQVALSIVLLVGGLLYAQTYLARVSIDKGFDSTNLASLTVIVPPQEIGQISIIRSSLIERLAVHPGVRGVVIGSPPPLGDSPSAADAIEIDGSPVPSPGLRVSRRLVSPAYLELIGVRLIDGRYLFDTDPASQVVVSELFARRFWPSGAIGRTFRVDPRQPAKTIVGVVAHIRSTEDRRSAGREPAPVYYEPLLTVVSAPRPPAPQAPGRRLVSVASGFVSMTMRLDAEQRLSDVIATVRREIPQFAVNGTLVADDYRGWESETRLQTTVVSSFGVVAFLTALIGLYGVMTFMVAGRTRELGVRVALGASRRDIVSLVMAAASKMSAGGAIAGLAGAFALSHLVESQMFGVSVVDAATYVGVAGLVVACATAATWLPARRASRIDPAITLRAE